MIDVEKPYICFDCTKVGKCPAAPKHAFDCKNFELFEEVPDKKVSTQYLADVLGVSRQTFYHSLQVRGWKYIAKTLREKGVKVYRETAGGPDKRYNKKYYVYYLEEDNGKENASGGLCKRD